MGISPGGARESSPWREPWEQTRTARSPGGAKEPFHGDSPIAGHERPSYAPTGLARLWAGPTGLTPWASHRAYALGYSLVPLTGLRTAHAQDWPDAKNSESRRRRGLKMQKLQARTSACATSASQ